MINLKQIGVNMFGVKKSSNKIENLRELLIMQKSEKLKETETIWDFVNNNFIGKNFGGKASTTDYLIMNIMNEWKSMFSYPEGFKQGVVINPTYSKFHNTFTANCLFLQIELFKNNVQNNSLL